MLRILISFNYTQEKCLKKHNSGFLLSHLTLRSINYSVCNLSFYLSFLLFLFLLLVQINIFLPICPVVFYPSNISLCIPFCIFISPSLTYLSIYLVSIYFSFYLSIYLSIYLFIYVSIYQVAFYLIAVNVQGWWRYFQHIIMKQVILFKFVVCDPKVCRVLLLLLNFKEWNAVFSTIIHRVTLYL